MNAPRQYGADAEHRQRDRGGPAMRRLGVGEPVDQGEEPRRGREDPGQVEPRLVRVGLVAQQDGPAGDRRAREEEVHVEAPAPGQVLRQDPAEQQADAGAAPGQGPEHAEGLAALGRLDEGGGQQRERSGSEQRAEHALRRPRGDEQPEGLGRPTGRGGDREADEAGEERPLAAEEIGDPAAEQEERAEGERVGRDHPLTTVVREAQRLLRRGQGDVHDGRVEDDHELGDPQHSEDEPAAVVMWVFHRKVSS